MALGAQGGEKEMGKRLTALLRFQAGRGRCLGLPRLREQGGLLRGGSA